MVGSRHGKMLVPLLGVMSALAIGVAAVAIYLHTQERDKRIARERDLEIVRSEKEELSTRLGEVQELQGKMEEELARMRRELTESKDELAQAVASRETLAKSVEDREQEIARITKELEQTKSEAKNAVGQLAELQQERDAIRQQMTELEQAKSQLETKILELSERPTVELEKVVVGSDGQLVPSAGASVRPASATTGSRDGQVVNVNREYDFVVVNLGTNHGLSVGQECQIVRDNQVLGRIKLEKVYDELSAAAILPDSQKENIREGDVVRIL